MLKQAVVQMYFFPFIPKIFNYQEEKTHSLNMQVGSCNVSHTNNDAGNRFWIQIYTTLNSQILTEAELDCSLDSDGSAS